MTDRELMQQALEALEIEQFAHKYLGLAKAAHIENTITALRERLAQQEPVAWVCPSWLNPDTRKWESESFAPEPIKGWIPLYTAPRQWQGLTEAEKVNVAIDCGCADVAWMDFADAIEAKLKEKNT